MLKRLMPRSMVARITWLLAGGMALVILLADLVFFLLMSDNSNHHRFLGMVAKAEAVIYAVSVVESDKRAQLCRTMSDEMMQVRWSPRPSAQGLRRDWGTGRLEDKLREHFRLPVREIHVGHPDIPDLSWHEAPFIVTVQLADESWLEYTVARHWWAPNFMSRLLLVIGLMGLALMFLAYYVARRINAPLNELAQAARRFGADVEAPALVERGPVEIRAASAAFNEMQRRIRNFVQERTQMIAAISHDLRTPLTRLRLRLEYIDDPRQKEKATQDLDEMNAMLAATLSFSREDAVEESLQSLNMANFLGSLCDDLKESGMQLECGELAPVTVRAKPLALRRALSNLIENGVRYGERVVLNMARQDGALLISLRDFGPGIPVEERDKVFMPFYRIEASRNRATGGTGLGLSVARTIIKAHGGEITLVNHPAGGLEVTVRLPLV